jgi:hypothetical protein
LRRGSKRVSVGRGTNDNKALHHGLLLLEAIVTAEVMKKPDIAVEALKIK